MFRRRQWLEDDEKFGEQLLVALEERMFEGHEALYERKQKVNVERRWEDRP